MCPHRHECVNSQVCPLSVQCVHRDGCVNSQVFPLSVQCVHRDRCVHSKVCTPTLCSVCTVETGVLIHRSACPLFFSVCTKTYGCVDLQVCPLSVQCVHRDRCVNSQVFPLSVQCVHRDGCVNLQVCMPTLCSMYAQSRRLC